MAKATDIPLPPVEPDAGDPRPPRVVGGKPNPEFWRWSVRQVTELALKVATGETQMPHGFNLSQAREILELEAKGYGIDPKRLADARSQPEIASDAIDRLLDAPESIFEQTDTQLTAIEQMMDLADQQTSEVLAEAGTRRYEDMQRDIPEAVIIEKYEKQRKQRESAKKKWRDTLRRVRKLRQRVRQPVPDGTVSNRHHSHAAARVLRYMIYVTRTTLDGSTGIARIGYHHAEMAAMLYHSKTGWYRDWNGCVSASHNTGTMVREKPWDGAMFVLPPGHGKTHFAASALALELSENPRLRFLFGHAQAKKAEENLRLFSSFFDPDVAAGRRNRSLFDIPPIAKNTVSVFDLEDPTGEKKKALTVTAYGMTAKISGSDTDRIWFDDPCDQELAEQETTRKRIFDRMNGTWRTRKRGTKAFELITTTLWHHDDPNCRWLDLSRTGKINCRHMIRACGGPEQGFKSLWPEVYPSSYLKSKYAEMRNPRLYAAAYQSNPQPEELRPIRRLAYYDPAAESHKRFMASAVFYLSLDPAATNRDKSDHASYVYSGEGDIEVADENGNPATERRLRIIDAEQFHANQTEGVMLTMSYAETHPTHYLLTEVAGGFHATVELFESHGIDVIGMPTGNKSKALRLKHVAPMLDDSLRDRGLSPAVVEFPGRVREDGTIGPDPESPLAWLEEQILNFGSVGGDHGVDALTQTCKHVGPSLGYGEGAVTRQIKQSRREPADPRLARHLRSLADEESKTPGEDEHRFMCGLEVGDN